MERKSDFCTKRGWNCAFLKGKEDFCTKRGWDCAFSEGKSDFCTKRGRDCAFLEEKRDFCTKRGWDCAFQEGKKDLCKININKKDASEWGIGTDGADIMFCEVLFDRITLVCYYGRVMRWQGSEMPPKW